MKEPAEQDHYEVLDLTPGCSDVEVEAAYERARRQLGPDSLATYALVAPEESRLFLARLEEAYRVLADPEARRAYDLARRFPENARQPPSAPAALPASPVLEPRSAAGPPAGGPREEPTEPPRPVRKAESDLPADAPITGEVLRRIREARGLSLDDLAGRTRISRRYFEAIEQERFAALPVTVYLRGFLISLARELRLDPLRVSRGYLDRVARGSPQDQ